MRGSCTKHCETTHPWECAIIRTGRCDKDDANVRAMFTMFKPTFTCSQSGYDILFLLLVLPVIFSRHKVGASL